MLHRHLRLPTVPLPQTNEAHNQGYLRLSGTPDIPETAGNLAEPKESCGAPTHVAMLRLKAPSGEATTRAFPPLLEERGGYDEDEYVWYVISFVKLLFSDTDSTSLAVVLTKILNQISMVSSWMILD